MVRRTFVVAVVLVALGVAFTGMNANLPILRNSLVYARTVENLERHHLALSQVCSDPSQVHSQGCGFSLLAVPFARIAGLNVGLKLASCFATALLVASMIAFFRRFNPRFGLSERDVALELVVACFNPILMSQFWSAHADSAFAALFLLSFVLLDRLLLDDTLHERRTAFAYTLTVMLAVFTRPAGLVLYPLHAAYVLWHRQQVLDRVRSNPGRLVLLATSAVVLAAWVGLGKLGHNPLLNLNKGEYQIPVAYLSSVAEVVALIVLSFGVLLLVTLPRLRVAMASAPLLIVLAGYVHILMVFHASVLNLRYYVPVIPFMALFVVQALRAVRHQRMAGAFLVVFAVTNGAMVLAFDQTAASRVFARFAPHQINWGEFGHFDNLRIATQVRTQEALDRINAELPPGARLYYVSAYYDGVDDGIYQNSGLIRRDIHVLHAKTLAELGPLPEDAWVFFPDKITRHPGDPEGPPAEWLIHRQTRPLETSLLPAAGFP